MFKSVLALLVLLAMAAPVWSAEALVGVYGCTDCVTYTVVVRDDGTTRINMEVMGEPYHVYVILQNNDYWLVTTDEHGKDYVSNYSAAKRELLQNGLRVEKGLAFTAGALPAPKTIGTFKADVFIFTDKYDGGKYEFALSEAPDIYALSNALLPFVADFGHMPEFNMVAAFNQRQNKYYGLVSFNGRFWLENLERREFDDPYFMLPPDAAVVSLEER